MLRGTFRPDSATGERYFRWRGGDVSRLEGLADAIFALALTLLVVRLEVPQSFAEVRFAFVNAPVYLACFALFLWIWHCHYQFHRRYGLEGPLAVALDGALLFCVLMFALPLRFVAELMWTTARLGGPFRLDPAGVPLTGPAGGRVESLTAADGQVLMLLYSGGFALLFAILALQTAVAYRRRDALQLDELERYLTRAALRGHLATVGVALLVAALVALGGPQARGAGFAYALLGPVHGLHGWRVGRRCARLAGER